MDIPRIGICSVRIWLDHVQPEKQRHKYWLLTRNPVPFHFNHPVFFVYNQFVALRDVLVYFCGMRSGALCL